MPFDRGSMNRSNHVDYGEAGIGQVDFDARAERGNRAWRNRVRNRTIEGQPKKSGLPRLTTAETASPLPMPGGTGRPRHP